jgi:hypothetical protein
MVKFCPYAYCDKTFANNFTLDRHLNNIHKMEHDGEEEEPMDSEPSSQAESGDNSTVNGEESAEESETCSKNSDDQTDVNKECRSDYWQFLVEETFREMDLPSSFKELTKGSYFRKFLKKLHDNDNWFYNLNQDREENDIIKKLTETTKKFERDGYNGDGEADELAWKRRCFLLKTVLNANKDLYTAEMENDYETEHESGEEEEEEEEEEEQQQQARLSSKLEHLNQNLRSRYMQAGRHP